MHTKVADGMAHHMRARPPRKLIPTEHVAGTSRQLTTAGEARASTLSHASTTAQTTRKWTYAATLPYVNGIASIASHTFFATVPLT